MNQNGSNCHDRSHRQPLNLREICFVFLTSEDMIVEIEDTKSYFVALHLHYFPAASLKIPTFLGLVGRNLQWIHFGEYFFWFPVKLDPRWMVVDQNFLRRLQWLNRL